tara:strand:+ start:2821 stop:3141 length:321 start_codon:yes stop_codon:yes gene_type:complete
MANIKILRLDMGADIIAEILKSDDIEPKKEYKIKNAFVIVPMPATKPGGPLRLSLSPYIPYSDDKEFILSKDKVVTVANPKTDILNSYNANVGSGVVVPNKKLITE